MKYKIENGRITATRLGEDHGCLTAYITVEGAGWGCSFGGYVLDHWFGQHNPTRGTGAIVELLKALDLESWESLTGTYVRVKTEGFGGSILAIGHIYNDQWFSFAEYFRTPAKEEADHGQA